MAALLDLGADPAAVRRALQGLGIPEIRLRTESVHRGGIRATSVLAPRESAGGPARSYGDIRALLDAADVLEAVRDRAQAVFARLAEAEARVHGVALDRVHFHEIGGLDALLDVVGVSAALASLSPGSISSSPVALGDGTVETAHGTLPVPAPATAELLLGTPVVPSPPGVGELVTPTGAALLATFVEQFCPPPPLRLYGQGFGAGSREIPGRPNVLRVLAGVVEAHDAPEREASAEQSASSFFSGWVEGAANLDDMNPELGPWVLERLFEVGARDAWMTPVTMKKGRAAVRLGFLCRRAELESVTRMILRESTTLGLRFWAVERREVTRHTVALKTELGSIRIKVAGPRDHPWNVAPEHEDCRQVARSAGVPLKEVYAMARRAYDEGIDRGVGSQAGEGTD